MVVPACDGIHAGMHHDFGRAACHGLESGEAALVDSGIYTPDPCADHAGEGNIRLTDLSISVKKVLGTVFL